VSNSVLTILVLYYSFSRWLFDSPGQGQPKTNLEALALLISQPYAEVVLGVVHIVVLFFLGLLIIRLLWNRILAERLAQARFTWGESYTAYLLLVFLSEFLGRTAL
jgi:hypothetical protein